MNRTTSLCLSLTLLIAGCGQSDSDVPRPDLSASEPKKVASDKAVSPAASRPSAPDKSPAATLVKIEGTAADLLAALPKARAVTLQTYDGRYVYRVVRDRNDNPKLVGVSGEWRGPARLTILFHRPQIRNAPYLLTVANRSGNESGTTYIDLPIAPGIQMSKFQVLDRVPPLEVGQTATIALATIESGKSDVGELLHQISLKRHDQPVLSLSKRSDSMNYLTRATVQIMRVDDDWTLRHPSIRDFWNRKDWPSSNRSSPDR